MAVVPVGDDRYDVVTAEDRVYTVDLPAGTCTCPDSRIRGARCKHVRRVAADVAADRVPAPGEREATCADCGRGFFVDEGEPDPVYCSSCTLQPGETVVDRERGDLVVVVRSTDRRAEAVPVPAAGESVADYRGNEAYARTEPVVEVLYPIPAYLEPDEIEARHLKRYAFPRGRLERRR
jgi:hypothetical protein